MPTLLELYRIGKEKVPPDKMLIALAISLPSATPLVAIQTLCTVLLHETGKELSSEAMKLLAVALIGLVNLTSFAVEIKALDKRGYSASPISTALQASIKNSKIVSFLSHAINTTYMTGLSPGNLAVVLASDPIRVAFENAAGVAAGLALWKIVFNILIYGTDHKVLFEPAQKLYYKLRPDDYPGMRDINKLQ